jgi:hypothetical protein
MTQDEIIDLNLLERFQFQLSKPRINFDGMTAYSTYFNGEPVLENDIILLALIRGLNDANIEELKLTYGEDIVSNDSLRYTIHSVLNERHLHLFELDDSDDGSEPLIKFKQHINPFYVMKNYEYMNKFKPHINPFDVNQIYKNESR